MYRRIRSMGLVAFLLTFAVVTNVRADGPDTPQAPQIDPVKLAENLAALPQPNSIDSGANDLTLLRGSDHTAIELHRLTEGFERGTLAIVFPNRSMATIIGKAAEEWITKGMPIAGFAYGGMPVSEFASVAWARQNLNANAAYALDRARKSTLFKDALTTVVKTNASLARAAKSFNLQNAALAKALETYGESHPRFAAAMQTLQNELNAPVVAVVNGFGVPKAGSGQDHYHKVIRPKNRLGQPGADVADEKVARLIFERWKTFASQMGLSDSLKSGGKTQILYMLKAHQVRTMFGTALIGHCAGAANAANTAMHLAKLVQDNAGEFPLGRYFLAASNVIGYGASFNTPKGLQKAVFYVGKDDHFGRLNSQEKALVPGTDNLGHLTVNVNNNHMMNPANGDVIRNQPALPTFAVSQVLGDRTFADHVAPNATAAERLVFRINNIKAISREFAERAAQQSQMLHDFRKDTAGRLKNWMLSTALTKVSLRALKRIYAARSERAIGLSKVLEGRQLEAQAQAFESSNPRHARALRRQAASKKSEGWRQVSSAKRSETYARVGAETNGAVLNAWLNWHGMSPAWEYVGGVHGANNTEIEKRLRRELGEDGWVGKRVEQVVVGQTLNYQLARTHFRALVAYNRVRWGIYDDAQKEQMVSALRTMGTQIHKLRANIGKITPEIIEAIKNPKAAKRHAAEAAQAAQAAAVAEHPRQPAAAPIADPVVAERAQAPHDAQPVAARQPHPRAKRGRQPRTPTRARRRVVIRRPGRRR